MPTGRLRLPAVSASSDDARMAITMQNYSLTWTDPDGTPKAAVVSYDQASAGQRKQQLEAEGCTEVEVVETKPGELGTSRG